MDITIDKLIFDNHNANKGTERGTRLLESSLSKYGAGRSILLDRENRVIAGNKTLEMAGQLGFQNVKVVETDGNELVAVRRKDLDLENDSKARELAYADNRVSELDLSWDIEVLREDLKDYDISEFFSDFDIEKFSSKEEEKIIEQAEKEEKLKQEEQENDREHFNDLNDWQFFPSGNKFDIPELLPNSDVTIPDELIEYREPIPEDGKNYGVHFFMQDYRIRSIWTQSKLTIERIKKVGIALSPDFSPYGNYPLPLRLYNVYRNRWCGRWFQENDIQVIPTITWSCIEEDFEFLFTGIQKGSVVAFSIVGGHNKTEEHWKEEETFIKELMNRLEPSKVLIYGESWKKYEKILKFIPEEKQVRYNSRWKKRKGE